MNTISVREARQHLAELLDEASAGGVISITRHGREVARLVPPAAREEAFPDLAGFRATIRAEGTPTSAAVVNSRDEERF